MGNNMKYYLINGKIMKGGEMPNVMYNHPNYNDIMMTWKNSLQPCEISESELIKIRSEIADLLTDNPIEITDIVRVKEIRTETKSGGWTDYKIYFKQPKAKEDSEAVECNDENMDNFINKYIRELPKNWRGEVDLYLGMKNAMLEALSYPEKYTITRNI